MRVTSTQAPSVRSETTAGEETPFRTLVRIKLLVTMCITPLAVLGAYTLVVASALADADTMALVVFFWGPVGMTVAGLGVGVHCFSVLSQGDRRGSCNLRPHGILSLLFLSIPALLSGMMFGLGGEAFGTASVLALAVVALCLGFALGLRASLSGTRFLSGYLPAYLIAGVPAGLWFAFLREEASSMSLNLSAFFVFWGIMCLLFTDLVMITRADQHGQGQTSEDDKPGGSVSFQPMDSS